MTDQLPLPGIRRNRDPKLELEQILFAKVQVTGEFRNLINRYGENLGLGRQAVDRAEGYAADLVSDLFFDREERLRSELEQDVEAQDDPWGLRHWRRPWT